MTRNNLFLRRLVICTEQGKTAYDQAFHRGVNIIHGQNSSGKSTIVRFIFFVLGGYYIDFVPEALKCRVVFAEVETGGKVYVLKRYLERRQDGRVNGKAPIYIYFGSMAEYHEDPRSASVKWQKYGYDTTNETRSFSNVLFQLMGLPEMRADSNITMYQILRLIYLDQESPLSSLFYFDQWDTQITRETVAELLMGLYNDDLSQAKLDRIALGKQIEELDQAMKTTRKHMPSTASLSTAHLQTLIDNKKKEIEEVTLKVKELREGEAVREIQVREYQRLQADVQALRERVAAVADEIAGLKTDIQDSTYFIRSLQRKIEAVDRSIATRQYFDNLHLAYCPECLSKIEDNAPEGHCRLCKAPIDNSGGRSQAERIKLELGFQIRESQSIQDANKTLLKKKQSEQEALGRDLQLAQERYDYALRNVRSTRDEEIDKLIQHRGFMEGEVAQFLTMMETAADYEKMVSEKNRLTARDEQLQRYIDEAEKQIKNRRVLIERSIRRNGIYLLQHDQDRQAEFRAATDFKMDYAQNAVYLSDRQIKLSASSAFYLKMAARFAFFLSSVEEDGMMYPRLLFSDNMEDKGMEEDRSRNFQRILVQRLKEMGRTDYQVIFATSNIAPELNTPEYTIGEYYTQSNKSLKNVN